MGTPQPGQLVVATVAALRNTHHRLQRLFSCGRVLADVVDHLLAGVMTAADFPRLTVTEYEGKWYSANNRRLWCLKQANVATIDAIVGEPDHHFLKGLNT